MLENGYAPGFMPAQPLGQYPSAQVMVDDENQPPYGMEFDPPVSENWSVFQPLPQGVTMFVPFTEVDPTSSEPGQLFEQPGLYAMDVAQYEPENTEEEPTRLGSAVVDNMGGSQVLFSFGVLCIMARLSPQYQFKYGDDGGNTIGARLTMYGHTIMIKPMAENIYAVRLAACRRALEKLRKYNPGWLLPPLPMDGPTSSGWNWVQLLQDYCGDQGWPIPGYNVTTFANKWHCDVSVNYHLFRTVKQCETPGEAQNTAAHAALYEILANETLDTGAILPPDPPTLAETVSSGETKVKREDSVVNVVIQAAPAQASVLSTQTAALAAKPTRVTKASRRRQRKGATPPQQPPKKGQQPPPKKGQQPPAKKSQKKPEGPKNANLEPLVNRRLAPVKVVQEPVEDPLAQLKAVQAGLEELHATASYYRMMKKICDVLKISYPDIRYQHNVSPGASSSHVIHAWFDASNPYLSRASPLLLACVSNMNEEDGISLGIKKVILFLLKMLKDDAVITSSDVMYAREFGTLHGLEFEIEERLNVV